jgi:hypothetical protein
MIMKYRYPWLVLIAVILQGVSGISIAQVRSAAGPGAQIRGAENASSTEEIVKFPESFFQQYNPNNALDMVTQTRFCYKRLP